MVYYRFSKPKDIQEINLTISVFWPNWKMVFWLLLHFILKGWICDHNNGDVCAFNYLTTCTDRERWHHARLPPTDCTMHQILSDLYRILAGFEACGGIYDAAVGRSHYYMDTVRISDIPITYIYIFTINYYLLTN